MLKLLTGGVALLCFLLMAVKYPLRKLHMDKANALLMRLHEAVSAGMLLAGIAHMIIAVKDIRACGAVAALSGFAGLALCLVIIVACHLTKDVRAKMSWHRGLSLALALSAVIHIAALAVC